MLKSRVHGYFVLVFIRKLLVSIAFAGLKRQNQKQHPILYQLLPVIYCEKCEYEFF